MFFLEGLIQAKPPLKPFCDAKTYLVIFISLLKPKVHFPKVTRVITLAPHEVHPYHSTERRYPPSCRLYRNEIGISCLRPWRLSLVVPNPKDPYTQLFLPVIVVLLFNCFEFSCLAKSFSVSGLTPWPQIPNQHDFIKTSAHEVLDGNLEARVRPVFT